MEMSSSLLSGPLGSFAYVPPGRRRQSSSSSCSSSSLTPTFSSTSSSPRTPSLCRSRRSSTLSSRLAESWRTDTGPLSLGIKGLPCFDEVDLGMVFFLPDIQLQLESRIQDKLAGSSQFPWNHPAVVVAKSVENGEQCVRIRLCTSFRGQRVEDRKPYHQQKYFVLADNSEDLVPHCNTRLARMEPGSASFSKRTYVNMSHDSEYPIEYKHLALWECKPSMRFDHASFEMIMANCRY
jgi:hypothetical protein